jgi:hypothetical protein
MFPVSLQHNAVWQTVQQVALLVGEGTPSNQAEFGKAVIAFYFTF